MMRLLALCAAGPLAASLVVPALADGIGGPVSGFVVDGRTHVLRPINGLPGSATLGSPVRLPFAAGIAAVATGLDYAIVTDARGGGQPFLARGLASGAPTVKPLAGGIAASQITMAASGMGAILYSATDGRLQFVSGLPDQPQAGDPADVSVLTGGVTALAVDRTGRTGLLIAGDGGIYRVDAGSTQGPQFIVRIAGASSAALLPNGKDAIIGNSGNGDVLLIRDFAGSAAVSTLTGARDGLNSATAVQALNDHEAGVIDGTGRFAVVNIDNSAVSWIDLAGKADRFEPVDGNLLLLNHPGPHPLLMLDLTQGRTPYFVPPDGSSDSQPHKGIAIWKHQ